MVTSPTNVVLTTLSVANASKVGKTPKSLSTNSIQTHGKITSGYQRMPSAPTKRAADRRAGAANGRATSPVANAPVLPAHSQRRQLLVRRRWRQGFPVQGVDTGEAQAGGQPHAVGLEQLGYG
jgi:hypothetical protein